jgi:hypothetical protein
MTADAIIAVSAAVVALTQLVKWSGLPDKHGPLAVLTLSLLGVLFWGWSQMAFSRAASWEFFAGWITIATSASGIYGFTRAGAAVLTQALPPPATGAGSEPTVKS